MARRRYQQGSVFQRGKRRPVWVGRWLEDEIRDGAVHRRHKSEVLGTLKELPSKKLALRRLQERLAPVNSPTFTAKHRLTFSQLATKWRQDILPLHKPSSQSSFKATLNKLEKDFGSLDLADIDLPRIQQWIPKQKLAPKTVRNRIGVFRLVWKYGRASKLVEPLDFDALILPKRGLRKVHNFTPEQVRQILDSTPEPFRTMFWIVAETGMRGGELCGLMCEDLQDRTLHIKRSAWRGKLQTPKTANSIRVVPISAALANHLRKWIAYRLEGSEIPGLMFSTKSGQPFDNYNLVAWQFKPVLAGLGLDARGRGLHALRHSNASALDSLSVPSSVRTDRLGHGSFEQTLDYTHAMSIDHLKAADRLGEIFAPSLPAPAGTC